MLLPVGGRADGQRPRLLHPVIFVDLRAKPRGDALAQGRREHGAGENEPAQGLEVAARQARIGEHHRAHGRNQIHERHALGFDQSQRLRRMEIHEHVASAEGQAGGNPGEADAPEGGEHRHQDVLRRRVEGVEHRADRAIVEMRQQVGFRQSGRARRQVEIIGIVLPDFDVRLPGRSAGEERLVIERPIRPVLPDGDEGLDLRQRRARLFGGGRESRLEQHGARAHRPHQLDDFGRRQPVVQRNADEAEFRQGEIDFDELGAIVAEKRDHVAFLQSEPREPVRQAIAALVDPAEGEAPAGARAEDRLAIAKSPRGGRHQGADDHLAERALRSRPLCFSRHFASSSTSFRRGRRPRRQTATQLKGKS